MKALLCLSLLSLATASAQAATDWSRFRGPNGSGIAADSHPPIKWSDTENLKWKTPLPGAGSSSPIIVGDRLYVTCFSGYGSGPGGSPDKLQRHLLSVNRTDGKIVWDKTVPAAQPEDYYNGMLGEHGYASHAPVSDGERIYVFFGKTGVLAFDLDGKQLWQVNVGKESGQKGWGSAASPVLYKDYVVVNASDESHSIRALDKKTGREIWKAEAALLQECYSTPILAPRADGQQDLLVCAPQELWALNPENGKLRWFAENRLPGNIAPSVVLGDGVAYAFGGFPQTGAVAVRTGGRGNVSSTNVLWYSNQASYVPTPVLHDGRLYVVTDAGFALCLDAKSGSVVYKERVPGASATGRGGKPFYASTVMAGGNLYAVSRRNGLFVIAAKPEFALVAQNKFAGDDTDFNATPALGDKELFLRSNRFLYCVAAP
jgi:outer membrane protein assembly factor BamB